MNAERRKEIARASAMIEEAKSILEQCRDDEEDYYSNMPDSIRDGEKGDKAQEAFEKLGEVVDSLDSAVSDLTDCME